MDIVNALETLTQALTLVIVLRLGLDSNLGLDRAVGVQIATAKQLLSRLHALFDGLNILFRAFWHTLALHGLPYTSG